MDMPTLVSLNSITIESNFKISAGPGAGKTTWLVDHLCNVIHHSKRLKKTRKVACITYTNVAVETIIQRLGSGVDKIEVSTIHSFLYKHIVKPYVHLIADEYELDAEKLDGHDDRVFSGFDFIKEWKKRTGQWRIQVKDHPIVVEAWHSLKWRLDDREDIYLSPGRTFEVEGYAIRSDSYIDYKKMCWARGRLHHDDVLFFSFHLIRRYNFILKVLRAKFPYFFVDEFQDTNPIQTKIIRHLAQRETIVGLIGDIAQSIYSFQGARPAQFQSFSLPNMLECTILNNYRSTKKIVAILNLMRSDLVQISMRSIEGDKPKIIIGDKLNAFNLVKSLCKKEELVYSLARTNITSSAMRNEVNNRLLTEDVREELFKTDADDRKYLIVDCVKVVELARLNRFKDATKPLRRYFRETDLKHKGQKGSLALLNRLLKEYDTYKNNSLYDFSSLIQSYIPFTRINTGRVAAFYRQYRYCDLALFVDAKSETDSTTHRTIHKSKGDEFDNVLLILDNNNLDFLLRPDLSKEEHRLRYVALSRARNNLFITVPFLEKSVKDQLINLGFDVLSQTD